MCDPFTVLEQKVKSDGWSAKSIERGEMAPQSKPKTYYFSVSALMVPVYLLCRCSSCEAAVYRRSDIEGEVE